MKAFVYFALICTILISPLLAETASPVDKLISKMPDDVLGFVASSGFETIKPQFDQSSIGTLWNAPSFQTFYKAIKAQVVAKMESEQAFSNDSAQIKDALTFFRELVNHPMLIGAAGRENADFPVYPFVVIDVSDGKARVNDALKKLHSLDKDGEIIEVEIANRKMYSVKDEDEAKPYWGWVDNYFVMTVNDPQGLTIKALSATPKDTGKYLPKVMSPNDVFTTYVDVTKILDAVRSAFSPQEAEEIKKIEAVLDVLGFGQVTQVKSSCGFNGRDIQMSESMALSGARKGLLAAMGKIDMKDFDAVDARAAVASVVNIDFSGIYDVIMQTVKSAAPPAEYDKMQQGIKEFESRTGITIRSGFLESISGPQTVYAIAAGSVTEAPAGGGAVIVKLKNQKVFEETMDALGKLISSQNNGMFQVTSQVYKGREVHFITAMPLAMIQLIPSWTIVDDKVLIASNQGLLDIALNQLTSNNPEQTSIRSVDAFKKEAENIRGELLSFTYKDSQKQMTQFMVSAQQAWPLVCMGLARDGINLPAMLPQLNDVICKMNPTVSYTWYTPDGIHTRYKGSGLEMSAGSVAGVAGGLAIMMPALGKTKKLAERLVAGTNLKGIGNACFVYAFDYEDNFPPDLETLVKEADLSPESLQSKRKPDDFDGPSYIYIPGQNGTSNPANILAYENPAFLSDGTNVLYADGHVAFVRPEQFLRELEETYKRLGKKMPETSFRKGCAP